MEETLPVVEVTVKHEPMDSDNTEGDEQNGYNQQSEEVKEEELWIKPEPHEDESQDLIIKEEDPGTTSENEARLDEEALNDEYNRNRQSNAPSRKQILVFLDFLNEHRDLANCMLRGPSGRVRANHLWETIAERLNSISGCIKTTQQWQRVWSDKKYLTRKAAAARYAFLAGTGAPAPELTLQDEKILAIIGESNPPRRVSLKTATPEVWSDKKYLIRKAAAVRYASEPTLQDEKVLGIIGEPNPPRRVCLKTATPEPKPQTPKQPQDVLVVSVPSKVELEPSPPAVPTEGLTPHPEVQNKPLNKPPRKLYTPRNSDSSPNVPSIPVTVPDVLHQPDVSKPPDEPPNPGDQELDDLSSSAFISDPPSPISTQQEQNRQGRVRLRPGLDPYTKKLIHLEERRLRNDLQRNEELSGIRNAIQEIAGLVKQFVRKDVKKDDKK